MSAITHIAAGAPVVPGSDGATRHSPGAGPGISRKTQWQPKKPPSSGAYGPADRVCVSPPAAESVMAPLAKRCRISSWACR
jgi:hypothetical protein